MEHLAIHFMYPLILFKVVHTYTFNEFRVPSSPKLHEHQGIQRKHMLTAGDRKNVTLSSPGRLMGASPEPSQ